MPVYLAQFERINFGFSPAIKQTADVAFQTDIPNDNEHVEEFEQAMWDAMWRQNPHWKDPKGPIAGVSGWSSVFGGNKVTRLA
jgi:hypothetical protein